MSSTGWHLAGDRRRTSCTATSHARETGTTPIYEGIDPLTGRDRRRWYPAGADKAAAEALASDLADRHLRGGGRERSGLTVAVYLTQRWLPAKKLALRPSTWDAYRRVIDLHLIPRIGRIPLRHLRPDHLERLYADLLDAGRADGTGGLNNKTVVEVHMILRRALDDAVRRGWIMSNPANVAHAPKRRPLASNTSRVWNAQQLRVFLTSTRDHRYHAALWVTANTGMRRRGLHSGSKHGLTPGRSPAPPNTSMTSTTVAADR